MLPQCRLGGVRVGTEHQHTRHLTGEGLGQSLGTYLRWDVLRDIGGADFGGDAPPRPRLLHHLQRVRRWLEPERHPCARGELVAMRTDGGRASLRVVGDGESPFEHG